MVTRDAALASDRSVALGQIGGHKPKAISGEHRTWLLERARVGDFALRGLVAELAESGLKVDHRAVWNFVQGEKLNFKKIAAASERDRPDIANHWVQRRKYQDQHRA